MKHRTPIALILSFTLAAPAAAQSSYTVTITPPTGGQISVLYNQGRGYLQCEAGKPYTSTCSASIAAGTALAVTATAGQGFALASFTSGCSGAVTTCTITLGGNVTLAATFKAATWYTLTLIPAANGLMSAMRDDHGLPIGCSLRTGTLGCAASVLAGTSYTISGIPDSGGTFVGFGGACSGTGPCHVTLDANKTVSATFKPVDRFTLTATPPAHGSIAGGAATGNAAISCGTGDASMTVCSALFAIGTPVTFTAKPAYGYQLSAWSGACTGSVSTCSFTVTKTGTVGATFSTIKPMYTLTLSPPTNGSLSATYDRGRGYSACGTGPTFNAAMCSASLPEGTAIAIVAQPSNGYGLDSFTGDCSGTANPCTLTVAKAATVSARFKAAPWYTLSITPTAGGTVTLWIPNQAPNSCSTKIAYGCNVSFPVGTVIGLDGMADPGKSFAGFGGACAGTGRCSVTVDGKKSVVATFR